MKSHNFDAYHQRHWHLRNRSARLDARDSELAVGNNDTRARKLYRFSNIDLLERVRKSDLTNGKFRTNAMCV